MIETLKGLVPERLLDISGVAPYTGRAGSTEPQAPVYFLALNPGGEIESQLHAHQSIGEALDYLWDDDADDRFSNYLDVSWSGRDPGTAPMQRRMQYVFGNLGIDLRRIPAANLVFQRSPSWAAFPYDKDVAIDDCWPFHQAVIKGLGIRTVIAASQKADEIVRRKLGAYRFVAEESAGGGCAGKYMRGVAYENDYGVRVIKVMYPGRFAWTSPTVDPTEFIAEYGRLH